MRKKEIAGYQSYGSAKGIWKIGAGGVLAALGGIGAAIVLAEAAGRWLPGLGELALYLVVLTFGAAGIAVCNRIGHFCWAFFFMMFCVFMTRILAITVRTDILAQATLTSGGSHVLLIVLGVILTLGIGGGLLFAFGWKHWVFVAVISVIVVFPTLKNCMDAINVAADKKLTHTAVAEVTQTHTEEEYVLLGKGAASVRIKVHYVTVAENDIIPAGTELKVSKTLYPHLGPGGKVRILLHPGALGRPWVEVAPGK